MKHKLTLLVAAWLCLAAAFLSKNIGFAVAGLMFAIAAFSAAWEETAQSDPEDEYLPPRDRL